MLAILVFLLLGGVAHADSGMLMGGVANRQMPLDVLPAPTACYSDRRLRTAYVANKAKNIVRASDSATTDIGFTANGDPDAAAETTFLASTTGKRVTWYDQCGTNNLTQATDANRPVETASCVNGFYCTTVVNNASGGLFAAANITPATGITTMNVIARRSATGSLTLIRENGANNRLFGTAGANSWTLLGGTSGTIAATVADAAWHSGIGVVNGASSLLGVEGTETTGTTTGNTTAGTPAIAGSGVNTTNWIEAAVWDNVALSAAQRNYLYSSQRIFGKF